MAQNKKLYFVDHVMHDTVFVLKTKSTEKEKLQSNIQSAGYLECNIDSCIFRERNIYAFGHLGNQYKFGQIDFDSELLNPSIIQKLYYQTDSFVNLTGFEQKLKEVQKKYRQNGFASCVVWADLQRINADYLDYKINVDTGQIYVYLPLVQKPEQIVKTKILEIYLGVEPNRLYNQNYVENISKQIEILNLFSEKRAADLDFSTDGKLQITIYPKQKASNNRAELLIAANSEDGKIHFQGGATIHLRNLFRHAETIGLIWQQYAEKSQKLDLKLEWPFIFATKWGSFGQYSIIKQDSSFLKTDGKLGLNYYFDGLSSIGWHYYSYMVWNFMQDNNDDINRKLTGISLVIHKSTGTKIRQKAAFFQLEIYNEIATDKKFWAIQNYWKKSFWLNNNWAFYLAQTNILYLKQEKEYLLSEMFQFGGAENMRGFPENSLFAEKASILNNEFSFLVGSSTRFFLLSDIGIYSQNNRHKTLKSIGLGMQNQFKNGIISFSYAIGADFDASFQFNDARIHISYSSLF